MRDFESHCARIRHRHVYLTILNFKIDCFFKLIKTRCMLFGCMCNIYI